MNRAGIRARLAAIPRLLRLPELARALRLAEVARVLRLPTIGRFLRLECVIVAILTGISIWVHSKFRLHGFGEQDAARLAKDAIVWHLKNEITSLESTYRVHTSPAYIHVLKKLMDFGMPIARVPKLMNWGSVVFGSLCSAALYGLFRQFSAARYAALAVFLYQMMPGFWLGNEYGMPTIPALCWFTLSLLLFVRATRLPTLRSYRLAALIAGSFVFAVLAFSFKADLALCTGAFVVAALVERGRRFIMLGLASFVVLGGVFVTTRYSHHVLTAAPEAPPTTGAFLKDWSAQFPFKTAALLDTANNQTIVHCAGGLLFIVLVLAVLSALVTGGRAARLAIAALVFGAPPILFWGLLFGNGARHSVFGMAPFCLVAAHFIFRAVNERTLSALLLALMLTGMSYYSDPRGRGVVAPGSSLLDATEHLEAVTQGYHRSGRAIAATPGMKRVVVGGDVVAPYLDFEIFAAAKHPVMPNIWEMDDGPQMTVFAHTASRRKGVETQRNYRREGFVVLAQ